MKLRSEVDIMNDIVNLIQTVGFPIAICLYLLWRNREQDENRREETEKFIEALNRNTLVLQKLCDRLGVENEVKEQ